MLKKIEKLLHYAVELVEIVIAIITLCAMIYLLFTEVAKIFVHDFAINAHLADSKHFLESILGIVIGLEFVSMLVDFTPANVLEVLVLAISRHVIINHTDPVSTIVCVVCIAGLFAIKRFLIPKEDMKKVISANIKHQQEKD